MSTKIAVNARNAAQVLMGNGATLEQVRDALDTVKQPSRGYYYITDIMKYVSDNETNNNVSGGS